MTWRLNFFLPKINLFRAATSTRLSADNPINTSIPYPLTTTSPSVSNGTANTNNSNIAASNWSTTNVMTNAAGNGGGFNNSGYDQHYVSTPPHPQNNMPASNNHQQPRGWTHSANTNSQAHPNGGYAYSNNNPSGQHNMPYNYGDSTYSSLKREPSSVRELDLNTNQLYL